MRDAGRRPVWMACAIDGLARPGARAAWPMVYIIRVANCSGERVHQLVLRSSMDPLWAPWIQYRNCRIGPAARGDAAGRCRIAVAGQGERPAGDCRCVCSA